MKIINSALTLFTVTIVLYSVLAAIDKENQLQEEENKRKCNSYCKHCGCMDFYCGEECICECNKLNKIGDDCIKAVQNDAEKVRIPFEILIHSPNANKYIKNAEKYSLKLDGKVVKYDRGKRSTIVIYRPTKISTYKNFEDISKIYTKILEARREIEKRQIQND